MELVEVNCLVVEDDLQITAYLSALLSEQSWVKSVTNVATLVDAEVALGSQCFDLILLDVSLPDGSSIEKIPAYKTKQPNSKILIFTQHEDEEMVLTAFSNGADGYLVKSTQQEELLSMIRSQMLGGTPMSPSIAGYLLKRIRRIPSPKNPLSDREYQVLKLLTKGCSYDEIAALMAVKKTTIATYIRRIYEKLGVRNRTEAIFEASHSGWLSLGD